MSTSILGKSIIVTGGGSGIGRAAALAIAKLGGKVLVADVNRDTGNETAQLIDKEGGEATFARTDIANEVDVRNMVEAALHAFGKLDGAFNNAAIPPILQPLHEISAAKWQRCIDVNLTGLFLCLKYEIGAMLKTGGGSIVNTSSPSGVRGYELHAEYMAAKHGLHGLTKAAAAEYGRKNIRVNTIVPGGVRTEMMKAVIAQQGSAFAQHQLDGTMLGRFSEPEEVAEAAIWLFSDSASSVTGARIAVDGGMTAKGSA